MRKKTAKLVIGKSYEIEWLDTFSLHGWWTDDDLKKKTKEMTYFQKSVGIFAHEDEHWIVIVIHENSGKEFARWGQPAWIPKGCIGKIRRI